MVSIFFARLLMAAGLVLATYNPTPFSLLGFLGSQIGTEAIFSGWAIKVILVVLFGLGWWVFLRTAYNSLRGMALAVGLILLLGAYVIINKAGEWGYAVGNDALIWVALFIVSFLLGLGATASHIKRRWAGIGNVDDIDEN
jgi:hypothetical protein